jgi:hypothetical protein
VLTKLMPKIVDLTDQRFGRLMVQSRAESDPCGSPRWLCKCDCGTLKVVVVNNLRSGDTKSCGCLRKELAVARSTTHGFSYTSEYRSLYNVRVRCNNPNDKYYHNYGGRGIKCLINTVEELIETIGYRPSPEHSIDRIDTNGNYEIGNIRWSTKIIQEQNRRNTQFITFQDRKLTLTEWSRELGGSDALVNSRLASGWSEERAVSTPVKRKLTASE